MLTICLAEAITCPAAAASVMGSPPRPTASAPGFRRNTMPAPTTSAVMSAARRSTTDRGERSQPSLLFIDASTSIYAGAAARHRGRDQLAARRRRAPIRSGAGHGCGGEGKHAATGSPPEVVAEAVLHILTSKRPRTRYPSDGGAAMISPLPARL